MFGVYVFAAIIGVGLLLFSLLAGGDGDHGADHDHSFIASADHPGWGELVLAFFRPRNFVFAAAAFGLTGTLLTLLQTNAALTLLASAGLGAGFFFVSHVVFQLLKRSDLPIGPVSESELAGERARVTLALEPGKPGRVACLMGGREVHLTARLAPEAAGAIAAGQEVVVVRVENGIAEVLPPQQYDRQLPA